MKGSTAADGVEQLHLPVLGCLLGLAAWWRTGHARWALGALLMIAN